MKAGSPIPTRPQVLLLAAALVCLSACETEILWIDPPVHYTVDHRTCGGDEDAAIGAETGIYEEQIFNPFSSHANAPISPGQQGGLWVMPALRTTGIRNPVRLRATITTADGEVVGTTVVASVRMRVSPNGACEILALPVPIQHAADAAAPIDDLYGVAAKLKIEVESRSEGGGKAVGEADVMLVKG